MFDEAYHNYYRDGVNFPAQLIWVYVILDELPYFVNI